jgi:hypothetical protein
VVEILVNGRLQNVPPNQPLDPTTPDAPHPRAGQRQLVRLVGGGRAWEGL